MRVELNSDGQGADIVWSVILDDGEQRLELICHNKQFAHTLRNGLVALLTTYTIEDIEE
jgi:hypothetical protein